MKSLLLDISSKVTVCDRQNFLMVYDAKINKILKKTKKKTKYYFERSNTTTANKKACKLLN